MRKKTKLTSLVHSLIILITFLPGPAIGGGLFQSPDINDPKIQEAKIQRNFYFIFQNLDKNKDASISLDEFINTYPNHPHLFEQIDLDKNGKISYDEFHVSEVRKFSAFQDIKNKSSVDKFFQKFDLNQDNKIAFEELNQPDETIFFRIFFADFDQNNDEFLSGAEFEKLYKYLFELRS